MSLFRHGLLRLNKATRLASKVLDFRGLAELAPLHNTLQIPRRNSSSGIGLLKRMASSNVSDSSGMQSKKNNPNLLIESKSPYLLQHAHNPVDWYPWGDAAFKKAREENKLIFLSVGYSTCHWCHVMEHESFESEEIAKLMNEDFVNIKVDREERPDVDRMYMSFVQAISGRGGWPMSVWLTPDLQPVYGGTYYPPDDRYYGQPGFATILKSLAKQWKETPEKFKNSGDKITEALKKAASIGREGEVPSVSPCVKQCFDQLQRSYEPRFGGFSQAPKFPQPVNLSFLLRLHVRGGCDASMKQQALSMCLHTLRMMSKGGIFDHVYLGFARYSTDERWHVPHFEKMLYDQAQLASVYTDAYAIKQDADLARVVRDILTYTSTYLSDPSGGFYSAEDADSFPEHGSSKKREGAFCVWTHQEIQSLLSELPSPVEVPVSEIVCHHFDIQPQGNVDPYQDPHDELKGQNVLIVRGSEQETAAKFGLSVDLLRESVLKPALSTMQTARARRPPPHLDDKMLAAWNGLMVSAFAKAGAVLKDQVYIQRAVKAAEFMRKHLYIPEKGLLLRSCYRATQEEEDVSQNLTPISGFLDDYAFTIRGLVDLYTACQDEKWILWADQLQQKQNELFWDPVEGGYFTSAAGDTSILIRLKEDQDGAEPSGNSVAVGNLERLSILLDRPEFHEMAGRILRLFGERLTKIPVSLPEMVSGLMLHHDSPAEVLIVGPRCSKDSQDLFEEAVSHWRCVLGQVVIRLDPADEAGFLVDRKPYLSSITTPGAYLCRNRTCSLPVSTPMDLRRLLDESYVSEN